VIVGGPGLQMSKPVPDGFGATSVAWDGESLIVGRSGGSVWGVVLSGQRTMIAGRSAFELPQVLGAFGGWAAWWVRPGSAISAAADGVPLAFKRMTAGAGGAPGQLMLPYEDAYALCGRLFVASFGGGRYTTHGKKLVAWTASTTDSSLLGGDISRDTSRSWVSPACSSRTSWIAASAGRNFVEPRFGLEHRSIWILSRDGKTKRQLTNPPAGYSDEAPKWSADGHAVVFVRTRADGRGALYTVTTAGRLSGPIADLGTTTNYYGHYGWSSRFDVAR